LEKLLQLQPETVESTAVEKKEPKEPKEPNLQGYRVGDWVEVTRTRSNHYRRGGEVIKLHKKHIRVRLTNQEEALFEPRSVKHVQ